LKSVGRIDREGYLE